MPQHDLSLVDGIRTASRLMVRELGFMQATLAATDYPPSAVHAILEIGAQGRMPASQLAQVLGLEKSSISRMARKLVEAGELKEMADGEDGRIKQLALTAKGRRTLAAIEAFGRQQVTAALDRMQPPQQQAVSRGLALYAQALQAHRQEEPLPAPAQIQVLPGYRPGCIGRIVEMHARFYARHAGFGVFFESRVASGLAEFAGRLDKPCNQLWTALDGERIVGSVAIDGEDLGNGQAHLRWFILDDGLRGAGIGRQLLQQALEFCDRHGFEATQLWTFRGLDAARRLYESSGFAQAEEWEGQQWGTPVTEQRFVRPGPRAGSGG
ncbi:ribosomal-protein-alanine acetyltransferase [Delftia tsuruhatensis]|uniref:helix-turn-helix domain-containing GNAT family N-acetyltransferase n=1 Tax=Delftia tsuruhatensis TaxID=180282 RepID=UPI001E70C9C6|nr:bifunctional helix-turn-helix transcriptional regulator/GNAT family N-acetyltransferase [Delftia tsuruhatensis]CAB5696868.1 ribosomal-protein-alanine acetyltransferase [Delftia tsuruhatensis]CAC9678574.1 ribosomal-protein-alanine acetyltransferase [Delftia tsuruhatensis]